MSLIDKLFFMIQPKYLYRGKLLEAATDISASLLHLASPKDHAWKFMDYVPIQKYSVIKYLGTVKQLKMLGDMKPDYLIFEVVNVKSERQVNPGDIIMLEKSNLEALYEVQKSS